MSDLNRRSLLALGGIAAGAALLPRRAEAQAPSPPALAKDAAGRRVIVPNGTVLPLRERDGVKIGHLVAREVEHEFAPGLRARVWAYNGGTPGPVIECVEGDRLRIYVTNQLPEPTTVHWHGLVVPNGMDGVSGLNQRPIPPKATWVYELTMKQVGTFMYHSHYDEMTQIALGLVGMIVVHPRAQRGPRVARDFVMMAHEWKIDVGARRPDPNAMADFTVLTFNGKAHPATDALVVGKGERVRIRFGNLGPMDHHPIHLHGVSFEVTATDGGPVPEGARWPETTVLLPVGSTRTIELVPDELGDWAMHCHMTHHVMTQMGHGAPNMVGTVTKKLDARMKRVEPGFMSMGQSGMGGMDDMKMPVPPNSLPMKGGPGPYGSVDMGGMFSILKVRDDPARADPKGWYSPPPGTTPAAATAAQLAADGIVV